MTGIRISSDALADLDEIWFHIAADNPRHADRFIDRLVDTLTQTLSVAPLAGRARDELGAGLRCLPAQRYLVFYRVFQADADVEIVRIIHGARDLETVFNE